MPPQPPPRERTRREYVPYETADPELGALREGMKKVVADYPGCGPYFNLAEKLARLILSGKGIDG